MSSRAQTRAQAAAPPVARGLKKNRRDKSSSAFYGHGLEHAAEDAAYESDRFAAPRAATEPRFGHDFSRLPVAAVTPAPVPSQLFVSRPQDASEQQARALARDAMTMPSPQPASQTAVDAPRQTSASAETSRRESIDAYTQSRLQALATGGHRLPAAARDFFEPRLGFDFSRIRIHRDAAAAELAADLDARAFTLGQHIVFNRNAWAPETAAGREVLAHELAHVAQQAARPQMAAQIHRDAAAKPTPAQMALAKALRGDDDDTRDLTHNAGWSGLELTAEQAALLLIHLLDGPTGDDDEAAGLKILSKMISEKRLNETLEALQARKYFGQLFDDFDGSEYDDLLKLLAPNITRRNVMAWTLDKFLSMRGTSQKEEEAIVVVLENGSLDDKTALLETGRRLERLRKTIDDRKLEVRFERIVRAVNFQRGQELAKRLQGVFEAKAKASLTAKQRTQEEVDFLLQKAAEDLTDELFNYDLELAGAIYSDEPPSPKKIADINNRFRKRLDELLETKSAEFDLELKYNVEFNRLLDAAYSRAWNKQDLHKMDEILTQIPPEILHANPSFRRFNRADRDPDQPRVAGQTVGSGRGVTLFSQLTPGTVAHELGHVVHFDQPALLTEFEKLSDWQQYPGGDFAVLVFDAKERQKLLAGLDEDRKAKNEYNHREHGNYYYRYDRYDDNMYWRYDPKACFITPYAETHPMDDFAESFETYMLSPAELKAKCLDKYKFMHIEVFVKYWLNKQTTAIQDRFDAEINGALSQLSGSAQYQQQLRTKFLTPLRHQLEQDLRTLAQTTEAAATAALDKALPLKGSTKAEDVGRPYFNQARDILALAGLVSEKVNDLTETVETHKIFIPGKYTDTFGAIGYALSKRFVTEALALLDPLVARILKGEHVEQASWPELEALLTDYARAVVNADSYLEVYAKAQQKSITLETSDLMSSLDDNDLETLDPTMAKKFPRNDKRREPVRQAITDNLQALQAEMERLLADILTQIQTGKPLKRGSKSLDADPIFQARLKQLTAQPKK